MKYQNLIQKQRDFFKTGKTKNYKFRLQILKKLKETIKKYENDIYNALYLDLAKTKYESYISELGQVLKEITLFEKKLKKWVKLKSVSTGLQGFLGKAYQTFESRGVTLIFAPWNYPILLTLKPLIGSIAAGNCCILKPSEIASNSLNIINKIISEIFDEEYVAVFNGDVQETNLLLENKFDYVFFTGSYYVATQISQKIAKHLTPATYELGGKSPVIVFEDANIDKTAKAIIYGKIFSAGQTCIAPDYILIHQNIYQKLIERLIFYIDQMYLDEAYPKIINQKHFLRIQKLLQNQKIIYGAESDLQKLKIKTALIDNPDLNSLIMQEEIFGPLLPILKFKNKKDIDNIINKLEKPLALYVFGKNKQNIQEIINNYSFGGASINDTLTHLVIEKLPFGGVGNSGYGRYGGYESFKTFSNQKSVYKKFWLFDLNLRYAPYNKTLKWIKKILK
ncbi:aldehyde dehydrogenase family protein [Mycoplasma leonicaptivi]|uniref:aldehyde dehydrogenase family protein n=1 Tax=Mycoplasma leonicaptivi TaxID=36742 RepID=UPI0004869F7C|nr:aldehyde dehydrogenase family protein [Mycoplasma leonicaptivi]